MSKHSIYWRWFDRYTSNSTEQESLQNKIYEVASLIAIVASVIGLTLNLFLGLSFYFNATIVFINISYATFFYFARYKNRYFKNAFVIVSQIGLILTFIGESGLSGPVLPLIIITIVVITAIADAKYQNYYLLLSLLTIVGLFLFEQSEYSYYINQYPNKFLHDLDITFVLLVAVTSTYFFARFIKNSFEKAHDTVLKQKNELEQLNSMKDKFFSILAHDLRGPFNGLIELTRLMSDESTGLSKAELQMLSGKLSASAKNTYGLLENLLSWAKMNQGVLEYRPSLIPLKAFASVHLEAMQDMADQKNIITTNTIPDDTLVFADEYMLQTILRNLIVNAIKFTQSGGSVSISASPANNEEIEIRIQDSGIGMDQETIDKLFTFDQKKRRSGTDNEPSSGLGLLVCKEFIDKHKGNIKVESEIGQGSCFCFTLPVTP